jgi:hypothetical protein
MFDSVLDTVAQLSGGTAAIHLQDWARLATLPSNRSVQDVQDLFYPDGFVENSCRPAHVFLRELSDQQYRHAYEWIRDSPQRSFPDVAGLLKTSKVHGKVMMQIMIHVVQWLNLHPAKVSGRENSKPPLRKDFLPALASYGDEAEAQSLGLQQEILTLVQQHIQDFTEPTAAAYLEQLPADQPETYAERFGHAGWKDLLQIVRAKVGPHLQDPAVARFNLEDPQIECVPGWNEAQIWCRNAIHHLPRMASNPALNDPAALDALVVKIRPLLVQWVVGRCREALEAHGQGETTRWPSSTVEQIRAQLVEWESHPPEDTPSHSTRDSVVEGEWHQDSVVEDPQPDSVVEDPQDSAIEDPQDSAVEDPQESAVEDPQVVEDPQDSVVEDPQDSVVEDPQVDSVVEESQQDSVVDPQPDNNHSDASSTLIRSPDELFRLLPDHATLEAQKRDLRRSRKLDRPKQRQDPSKRTSPPRTIPRWRQKPVAQSGPRRK